MKIDVWSDFSCPFCYMGKRLLELAIEKEASGKRVEIVYHSFELDPEAPLKIEESIHQLISQKYNMSLERARAMNRSIIQRAGELGLSYNFDDLQVTNTFDAHRLAQYAQIKGRGKEFIEMVFKAYFVDSLVISDHSVLVNLAEGSGLDPREAMNILASDQYSQDVRKDEEQARELSITGVPFFVFDGKTTLSGAQPMEAFIDAIHKVSE